MTRIIYFIFFILLTTDVYAKVKKFSFGKEIKSLQLSLESYKFLAARENINNILKEKTTKSQWLYTRDLIHKYPQVGLDILLKFDKASPFPVSAVDKAIEFADKKMLSKNFTEAAKKYQQVLLYLTKNKKFKDGRNYQLYWSLIHSLSRALYALKQYKDAYILYRSIPSSYPLYKQVQFELMWNNYLNERLEYSLGSIATMSSGHFSKILEPEAYLIQYYIYRRMCRDAEVDLIKKKVKYYRDSFANKNISYADWIKKDVETLVYKQVLQSGSPKGGEAIRLRKDLDRRLEIDSRRLRKEFDLVFAHIDLDSGKNKKLKEVNNLAIEKLLSTDSEKWAVDDNETWSDELGKQVFIQKDLCKK